MPAEKEKKEKGKHRKIGYFFTIVITIAIFYVVNNLLRWHMPGIKENFASCLTVINISLLATIAVNIIYLFFDAYWFRHLTQIILNIISVVVLYTLIIIFPFDTSFNIILRIAFITAIVAVGIGTVVDFVKLLGNKK